MGEILGLDVAEQPMRSSYDRVADYVSALGLLAATIEKIGGDVVFMQRTEIGEIEESFHMGKVGSSTMAQKRNPSTALTMIGLARMLRSRVPLALEAMVRMDEGDASATNVTDIMLPEVAILAASLAEHLEKLSSGLTVDAAAMRRNAEMTHGLIVAEAVMMRLAKIMGRHEAHHLLYEVAQNSVEQGLRFDEALRSHPAMQTMGQAELDALVKSESYTGQSAFLAERFDAFVDGAL
jgi:adenylosuccinate lyase/3-carboxy-cis,cis-muconate cycloisomerase